MIRRRLAALLTTAFAALGLAAPASALAAPVLDIESSHIPATVPAGTYAKYAVKVSNTGDANTSGNLTVTFTLPAGLKATSVTDEVKQEFGTPAWGCAIAGDSQSVTCSGPDIFGHLPIEPGKQACQGAFGFLAACRIFLIAKADPAAAPGTLTANVEACGGGAAACATVSDPAEIVPYGFRLTSFDGDFLKPNGDPATRAGSHPFSASNEFHFLSAGNSIGGEIPVEQLRDAVSELPPGLIGNPQAYPTCTEVQLSSGSTEGAPNCPPESQLGTITVTLHFGEPPPAVRTRPVYNMEVPYGAPAVFGFKLSGFTVHVYAGLRTGEDYGVTITSKNNLQTVGIEGVRFTFWGVPADPSHDPERWCAAAESPGCTSALSADPKPFVSLPTSCVGPVQTDLTVTSWEGSSDSAGFLSHDNTEPLPNPIGFDGCNAVDFSPSLEARPTTNVADSPSGLDVDLHIPQNVDPKGRATAHLRDATVTLPEGLVVNPSSANGLAGCSLAQFGYTSTDPDGTIHTTPGPATCPAAAKLGTVQVDTPLLDHPLQGGVYLAEPFQNPFDSLLALYIALDDPQSGTVVKLAGEVGLDSQTGRISASFENNPQLPFEHFRLKFFGGAGGSLRTPALCGDYTTDASLVPWTAPEGETKSPTDNWQINQGPAGSACAGSQGARPHAPDLDAGTVSPIAAAHTPLVVNLRRDDGSQEFSDVTITPPPGLTGKLAGIPYCPEGALGAAAGKSGEAEQAAPSCPAASRVGTVDVAAGAGPAPYWTQGTAYLTGPYNGAPLSLAIVTPATAGPFDLGTVLTRVALHVNPVTAQITADADPLPQILEGIPLDIRQALIRLDRPSFTLTGTSCDPLAFSGQLVSTLGAIAPLSERFQLGECTGLPFKPKMSLRLKGGTKRTAHPRLIATVTPAPGEANIAYARVKLPSGVLLDQSHIGTVCTRVQFAAGQCPAASVYGTATATTPLLDYPLSGPVYLRSSSNKLPDLVAALRGPAQQPIAVELAGVTDSVKGSLRNTFPTAPDVPVSSFRLELFGGSRGLVTLGRNVCLARKKQNRATVELSGHNGKPRELKPLLRAQCRGKRKAKRRAARGSRRRAAVLKLRAVR